MTKNYAIDIRVFETIAKFEIPFPIPPKMLNEGNVKPGFHTITVTCTEKELEDFEAWSRAHQLSLKILGSITL